jgi:hypothetical protein
MFKAHPNVLYIGGAAYGEALGHAADLRGWNLFVSTDMMEGLAQYVFYMPDVVVIDTTSFEGQEAFLHLRSINADPIVLLGTGVVSLDSGVLMLPENTSPETVLETLTAQVAY